MKYTVEIDVDSAFAPEVVLKDVRDALEQYYRHTHQKWIKGYKIQQVDRCMTCTSEINEDNARVDSTQCESCAYSCGFARCPARSEAEVRQHLMYGCPPA